MQTLACPAEGRRRRQRGCGRRGEKSLQEGVSFLSADENNSFFTLLHHCGVAKMTQKKLLKECQVKVRSQNSHPCAISPAFITLATATSQPSSQATQPPRQYPEDKIHCRSMDPITKWSLDARLSSWMKWNSSEYCICSTNRGS